MPHLIALRAAVESSRWEAFDELELTGWHGIATAMVISPADDELAHRFHSKWIAHGENIRKFVGDDKLLAQALRSWLPPYSGPDLELYRGESASRFEAGDVGFCWTGQRETAEMFGSGWQASHPCGGVLLRAKVPASAVLAAPNAHSHWLGEAEFTVDPGRIPCWEVIESYPHIS